MEAGEFEHIDPVEPQIMQPYLDQARRFFAYNICTDTDYEPDVVQIAFKIRGAERKLLRSSIDSTYIDEYVSTKGELVLLLAQRHSNSTTTDLIIAPSEKRAELIKQAFTKTFMADA